MRGQSDVLRANCDVLGNVRFRKLRTRKRADTSLKPVTQMIDARIRAGLTQETTTITRSLLRR